MTSIADSSVCAVLCRLSGVSINFLNCLSLSENTASDKETGGGSGLSLFYRYRRSLTRHYSTFLVFYYDNAKHVHCYTLNVYSQPHSHAHLGMRLQASSYYYTPGRGKIMPCNVNK